MAAACWPPARVEDVDGWQVYESGGGTRRTQSVQTSRWQGDDPGRSIDACERLYAERSRGCVFKLTGASEPAGLDAALDARGYVRRDETIVQTAPLDGAEGSAGCTIDSSPSDAWIACCLALSGGGTRDRRAHAETLRRTAARPAPSAFTSLVVDGEIAAIGLGAVDADVCFIGEVATHPGHRRAGHGHEIVRAIMGWARGHGAREALLQVVAANAPARRMYAGLGFVDRYAYWYREQAR